MKRSPSRSSAELTVIPPHNLEAERAVLGLLLREEGGPLLAHVTARLAPSDFYTDTHQTIAAAILRVTGKHQAVDGVLLEHELREAGQLEEVGGSAQLALLYDQAAIPVLADKYIGIVSDLSTKRSILQFAGQLAHGAQNGTPAEVLLAEMRTRVSSLEARIGCGGKPELIREGLDLALVWPNGVRFALTAVRDGRDGVRGELTVVQGTRRLSSADISLAKIPSREALRRRLEATAPGLPWGNYIEEAAWQFTQAARQGEPLVTLTGTAAASTRELVPRFLYEGEPTQLYADGDTGKSLFALALAVAVHSGAALPFGLKPVRAVPAAYLDWETSHATLDTRMSLVAAGLGVEPAGILYKRMTRPLIDVAETLAADFARRRVGFVVIDSMMFAVSGGEGGAFHEPITAFYNALRLFAPAASLVLNHVTNADARSGGPARPFGGGLRLQWPPAHVGGQARPRRH